MSKDYIDEKWCPVCDDYTQQKIHDAEHERDSSNDYSVCLECNTWIDGWGQPHGQAEKD